MGRPDSELAPYFFRRARRALNAALDALNAQPAKRRARLTSLGASSLHRALTVVVLRFVVVGSARARGLFRGAQHLEGGRLFRGLPALLDVRPLLADTQLSWLFPPALAAAEATFIAELQDGPASDGVDYGDCPAELVGNLYELLLGEAISQNSAGNFQLSTGARRKQTGTFFTPRSLTEIVVGRALEPLERRIASSAHRRHDFVLDFRVCDPAVGGGAFLVELGRALSTRAGSTDGGERRRAIVKRVLYGVDIDPVALAVAEAALFLFVADPEFALHEAGANLRVGDALIGAPYGAGVAQRKGAGAAETGLDFVAEFPEVFERGGFDLVIGNPPWVAYAGRAAKPLAPARKAYFAAHYTTLRGYPTLHGLFVERALRLAPQGTLALVVPSPIADLQGYRAVRRAVRQSHTPCEPMLEFGQDAFDSVTQPCFALIAEVSTALSTSHATPADAPFRLAERQHKGGQAMELRAPEVLDVLRQRPSFPRELFGEMGFQTSSRVTRELLRRADAADARHHYPLLEGRDVHAFHEGEPRLFLAPDPETLAATRCRLRPLHDYARVRFVIRQTARYPIAAKHRGLPFRNSLLAGFDVEGFSADLVVGLLNSALYRALHLAAQRDARQATFPQVKIAHLRALPAPPADAIGRARIASLSAELTELGVTPSLSERLDAAVFELFALEPSVAQEIHEFLLARGTPRR